MHASLTSAIAFSNFGDFLRFLRRRERLTQLELSIAVGYSEAQISRLEKNQRLPDLTALQACLERSAGVVEDAEAFLEVDLELHDLILAAARNQIMARFMASLTRLGMASRTRTSLLPGVRRSSLAEHTRIVAALLRRDPEEAAEAMRCHLEIVHTSLRESIEHEHAAGNAA